LIDLNEVFASQVYAFTRSGTFKELRPPQLAPDRVSHSATRWAATGGRILATVLMEMDRRGASLDLEAMCIRSGQELTAILEAVD
jgi:acetyl-CoA C-acetyltransferase